MLCIGLIRSIHSLIQFHLPPPSLLCLTPSLSFQYPDFVPVFLLSKHCFMFHKIGNSLCCTVDTPHTLFPNRADTLALAGTYLTVWCDCYCLWGNFFNDWTFLDVIIYFRSVSSSTKYCYLVAILIASLSSVLICSICSKQNE